MLADLIALLNAPAFSFGPVVASRAELLGAVLAVWMVFCNFRVNPLAWPLAIASCLMYGLVFWEARLYGEAGLQGVFILVALWGWWQWLQGRESGGARLRVRRLSPRGIAWALAAFALLWPTIALALQHGTDSHVPWGDALPVAGSLVAQVLLARKWVETWLGWLAVNVVSVVLFASQSLWLTVGLYVLFALLSVIGWRAWGRLADQGLSRA